MVVPIRPLGTIHNDVQEVKRPTDSIEQITVIWNTVFLWWLWGLSVVYHVEFKTVSATTNWNELCSVAVCKILIATTLMHFACYPTASGCYSMSKTSSPDRYVIIRKILECCHVSGVPWLTITCSGLDYSIYWPIRLQSLLITISYNSSLSICCRGPAQFLSQFSYNIWTVLNWLRALTCLPFMTSGRTE
jgi:hypothetical protein